MFIKEQYRSLPTYVLGISITYLITEQKTNPDLLEEITSEALSLINHRQ